MVLPKPNGDFEWVQESWGAALRCTPLAAIAPHLFSTRALTIDGTHADDGAGWEALARAFGVEREGLVRLRQVHGAGIFEAQEILSCASSEWPEADVAITGDPALALTVRAADCVPILLADRCTGAVAAVHAGWKGTAAGAVQAAVRELESKHGSDPRDVVAAVGPSIGPCCYEVGDELARQFTAHPDAPRWFSSDRKPRLDLWRATYDQLERAGLPTKQIHVCALCTFDHPALFHSYRRDGAAAGRLVAAIRSAPGKTL
ncbi:MAG TPA: peptidoglycan editing factor PgeF [Vicinamibacterales bacterium]|nr:peptidoglycan editing factor PgeF [Vicinamibacterales bacterium]